MGSKAEIERELQEQGRHDRGPSRTRVRKPERHGAPRRGLTLGVGGFGYYGLPTYGQNYYRGVLGQVTAATGGSSTPAPAVASPHLNPEQFVGYPGGYSTDAGNYTGTQALSGAEGNGGAGGTGGDSGSGGAGSGAGAGA